jgi:hypothetical protein
VFIPDPGLSIFVFMDPDLGSHLKKRCKIRTVSPEEKYYSVIRLLDQWNDKYINT